MSFRKPTLWLCFYGILSLSYPGFASTPIPLKQGMNYSNARQQLLNAGWQTKATRWQEKDCDGSSLLPGCKFPEVQGCSGSGLGFCLFNWIEINANRLSVTTTTGRDQIVRVQNWQLQ
jgi:hypothetical protein